MYPSLNARAVGLETVLSAEATIDLAAAHGFHGVDLMVRDLVDGGADLARLRRRLDDAGLVGGAWPLPIGWRDSPADVFHNDLDRLDHQAAAAAVLGLERTGTWVMPEAPAGWSPARTFDHHVGRLSAIARVLDRHGIRLGLEVIGVASSRRGLGPPFVHRLADLGPILDAVAQAAPAVGLLVDGFHLYAADEPITAALAWGAERIVWVHVADLPAAADPARTAIHDPDRGLPGAHPAVETAALLAALARAGYDGPVTPEPMARCAELQGLPADTAVRRVAEALRSVWPTARS